MDTSITIDLGQVARELNLPLTGVQRTLELLDEGNTVPFITRYRKDQTGALDDDAIRQVQDRVAKLRALAERKQTILKSIEAQGKLTPELAKEIAAASTTKRLEDLYLPFKPKKQTLATLARQRGLEPLANEILEGNVADGQLETRAAEFINEAHQLRTVAEVLQGVRHLLAERYSERAELRDRLRRFIRQTGKLVVSRIEPQEPPRAASAPAAPNSAAEHAPAASSAPPAQAQPEQAASEPSPAPQPASPAPGATVVDSPVRVEHAMPAAESPGEKHEEAQPPLQPAPESSAPTAEALPVSEAGTVMPAEAATAVETPDTESASPSDENETQPPAAAPAEQAAQEQAAGEQAAGEQTAEAQAAGPASSAENAPGAGNSAPPASSQAKSPSGGRNRSAAEKRASARSAKKQKKRQKLEAAFKDYFQFSEPLSRIPPHRILAINRGERARILRVKLELDHDALLQSAAQAAIPEEHPQREFLLACLRDSLQRLIVPSLERETRRELTEAAEQHALDVFVRNLRKLLLQPPVRGRRVLAVDPGFRSGCKLIALDEFGNVLGHDLIHVVGRDQRKQEARGKLAAMIRRYEVGVIAIGNGTGCRETEQLVADVLADEFQGSDLAYVIVNEAGASVYSTSPIGREELPDHDPVLRSAISIGRRLLDPLSELVKINPANIGVGLYQHDVKAKHLRDSLDGVVESCVNFVGVDVNTASPALLRYVSGLNQLTARRVFEYRRERGPFRNREQFREVPGFGEATFVQAAGFLKIPDGDNPLDATWIHPESYGIALRVLEKLGADLDLLRASLPRSTPAPVAPAVPEQTPAVRPPAAEGAEGSNGTSSAPVEAAEATADANAEQPSAPPVADQPIPEAARAEPAPSPAPAAESEAASEAEAQVSNGGAGAEGRSAAAAETAAEAERRAAARAELAEKSAKVDVPALARELGIGELLLRDILASLTRPGRDPRDDLPPPVFRRGIMKLEDLKPGMELTGSVLNVVDFGAFVDIGLAESGLIHISRLADRYVRDPHEIVGVGDSIKVWVLEVDKERRRVSLTAVPPGQERKRPDSERRSSKPADRQPSAARPAKAGGGGQRQQRAGRSRPAKGRSWTQPSSLPAKPLTKAMEEGKEPLRSFSDLLQFYEKKQHPDDDQQRAHE